MLKICKCIFAISATGGLIIYVYAFLSADAGFYGIFNVALRAIFSTMRMFLMNSDFEAFVDAVGAEHLQENAWISFVFLLIHVLAAVVIQAALLSIFGRKLIDWYRLRFLGITLTRKGFRFRRTEVYIINGCDKNALILGENIATGDNPGKPEKKERIVIFWIGEDDDEKEIFEKIDHFEGIVQKPERRHDRRYYLGKAGMGKRNGRKRNYNIIFMPDSISVADDVCEISKWAVNKKVPQSNLNIHVFARAAWDREKIQKITQETKIVNKEEIRSYPYAINVISIEDLLVRQMLGKLPPYKCKGLNISNAEAKRNFKVMILGFGFVGESALLHLIMNGQFPGSKMQAIIVDSKKDCLRECFTNRYPSHELCCDPDFEKCDVQSKEFYALLEKEENLDFIVITLNNDELNKQVAMDIRQYFYDRNQKREEPLPLPVITVFEKEGTLYDQRDNEDIYIFGCRDEILKDSFIIRSKLDEMAKAVNEVYTDKSNWNELDLFFRESNRASADYVSAMLYLACSASGADKNEEKISDINWKSPEDNIYELDKDQILVKIAEFKQALENNPEFKEKLAQTEHMRWNAFHAAMGYKPISPQDMRKRFDSYDEKDGKKRLNYTRRSTNDKLHACLVSWEELDEVSKVYRELAQKAGVEADFNKDFKDSDRDIVNNIPLFLYRLIGVNPEVS